MQVITVTCQGGRGAWSRSVQALPLTEGLAGSHTLPTHLMHTQILKMAVIVYIIFNIYTTDLLIIYAGAYIYLC